MCPLFSSLSICFNITWLCRGNSVKCMFMIILYLIATLYKIFAIFGVSFTMFGWRNVHNGPIKGIVKWCNALRKMWSRSAAGFWNLPSFLGGFATPGWNVRKGKKQLLFWWLTYMMQFWLARSALFSEVNVVWQDLD